MIGDIDNHSTASGIVAQIGPGITARDGLPQGEVCEVENAQLFESVEEAKCAASYYPGMWPDGYPKYFFVLREITIQEIE